MTFIFFKVFLVTKQNYLMCIYFHSFLTVQDERLKSCARLEEVMNGEKNFLKTHFNFDQKSEIIFKLVINRLTHPERALKYKNEKRMWLKRIRINSWPLKHFFLRYTQLLDLNKEVGRVSTATSNEIGRGFLPLWQVK